MFRHQTAVSVSGINSIIQSHLTRHDATKTADRKHLVTTSARLHLQFTIPYPQQSATGSTAVAALVVSVP